MLRDFLTHILALSFARELCAVRFASLPLASAVLPLHAAEPCRENPHPQDAPLSSPVAFPLFQVPWSGVHTLLRHRSSSRISRARQISPCRALPPCAPVSLQQTQWFPRPP